MTRQVVDGAGYEVDRAGDGPTVLLIHGFTGRGADWQPFLRALQATSTTITVDLLGHGASDAPSDSRRHAIPRQAADLAHLLRRMRAAPATIVGYSLGARVALRIAVDEPAVVSGLILESPSAGITDDAERAARRSADATLADDIERDGIAAFVARWESLPMFASEQHRPRATRARIRRARLRNRPDALAASLRGAGQGSMAPLLDRLHDVGSPTLVIAGALDAAGAERARTVADGVPDARLVTIPRVGHAPHRESPAEFRRLVIDQITAWRAA
jgi:2-succinyl-6-hydroxy-2,4-cyclohexadiene-1-carboxylate synthase